MRSTCPDGSAHHWDISSNPDPETKLYFSKCRKCGGTAEFTNRLPETDGFRHRVKTGPATVVVVERCEQKEVIAVVNKKGNNKGKEAAKERGWNFKDPVTLREREEENKQRKPEIIETYLRAGTYYQAAKDLDMPRNTVRQLIIKWDKAGDVDKVRRRLGVIAHTCSMAAVLGDMVSFDKSEDSVTAMVTIAHKDLVKLRLGKVEMRFIS